MPQKPIPVVLVHGWKSHPGIWNRLVPRLNEEGISFWSFDYTRLYGASMEVIAGTLRDFIATQREEQGYSGSIDMVCHSIGSCIARYLLEVMDGTTRHERVRQLIAIGPPNNGSALAELFCDPVIGPEITARLVAPSSPKISIRQPMSSSRRAGRGVRRWRLSGPPASAPTSPTGSSVQRT